MYQTLTGSLFVLLLAIISHAHAMDEHQDENQTPVVEFKILNGTGNQPWNTDTEPILAKVGTIIRFINEDIIDHQLHTYGAPCSHGPAIPPGKSWDCLAKKPYDMMKEGALYDHHFGPSAAVWLHVEAQ